MIEGPEIQRTVEELDARVAEHHSLDPVCEQLGVKPGALREAFERLHAMTGRDDDEVSAFVIGAQFGAMVGLQLPPRAPEPSRRDVDRNGWEESRKIIRRVGIRLALARSVELEALQDAGVDFEPAEFMDLVRFTSTLEAL